MSILSTKTIKEKRKGDYEDDLRMLVENLWLLAIDKAFKNSNWRTAWTAMKAVAAFNRKTRETEIMKVITWRKYCLISKEFVFICC